MYHYSDFVWENVALYFAGRCLSIAAGDKRFEIKQGIKENYSKLYRDEYFLKIKLIIARFLLFFSFMN